MNRPPRLRLLVAVLLTLGLALGLALVAPGAADASDGGRSHKKAPKPKGTTSVLVVPIYWKGTAYTDATNYSQQVITGPNSWYRAVSHGKYGLSGTLTTPQSVHHVACKTRLLPKMTREALKAAKHAGYKPKKYKRYVIVVPCNFMPTIGRGEMPGNVVWLFQAPPADHVTPPTKPAGTTETTSVAHVGSANFYTWTFKWSNGQTETYRGADETENPIERVVHEMGHNLKLNHAHYLKCTKKGVRVPIGGHCKTEDYGDPYDAMGNQDTITGSFDAPHLAMLHWLGASKKVKHSGTYALAPLEGTAGVKALKIKGPKKRTYWVELRTQQGVDADIDPASTGILVHYTKPHDTGTWLIDGMPGSVRNWNLTAHQAYLSDEEQSELPVGHTLSLPGHITITTVAASGSGATVTVHTKSHHKKKHHHKKHKKHHKKKH